MNTRSTSKGQLVFKCPSHPGYKGSRINTNSCFMCAIVFLSCENEKLKQQVDWLKSRLDAAQQVYY